MVGIEVIRIHHAGGGNQLLRAMLNTPLKAMRYQFKLEGFFKSGELIVESSGKGERIGECIAEPCFRQGHLAV